MARRYVVAPVVLLNSGTESEIYATKVQTYSGYNSWTEIPRNEVTGEPLFNWCLSLVIADSFGTLQSDATMFLVPPGSLDNLVNVGSSLAAKFQSKGIDIASDSLVRDIVRRVGQRLSDRFDENFFGVL